MIDKIFCCFRIPKKVKVDSSRNLCISIFLNATKITQCSELYIS